MYPLSLLLLLSALYVAQADESARRVDPNPVHTQQVSDAKAKDDAAAAEPKAEQPYVGSDKPLTPGPPPGGLPGGVPPGMPAPMLRAPESLPAEPKKPKTPAAEVYYYKDENGSLKAVDSIDAVPEKFRDKAKAVKKK